MVIEVIEGDLLDQEVDAIINPWNTNIIPFWLLIPQGVSGSIKKKAGLKPFRELPIFKLIPLGEALLTTAGELPFKGIIHVAGINIFWRATKYSITNSVKNSVYLAEKNKFSSIAMPIIGSGSGGYSEKKALDLILETLEKLDVQIFVKIVKYKK